MAVDHHEGQQLGERQAQAPQVLGAHAPHAPRGQQAVDRAHAEARHAQQQLARCVRRVRAEDLRRLRLPLAKLLPFVVVDGHRPTRALDASDLAARLRPAPAQASLFDDAAAPA